jgi:hypothetical protein
MATVTSGHGEGIFDYGAMFKSSGNLTATLTTSSIKMRGSGRQGSSVRVHFPSTSGTREQVLVAVHASVDDSTYRICATYPGGAISWASGAKTINVPFHLPKGYFYGKVVFTVTGGTTTTGAGFGAVYAGLVPKADDWDRQVRFD